MRSEETAETKLAAKKARNKAYQREFRARKKLALGEEKYLEQESKARLKRLHKAKNKQKANHIDSKIEGLSESLKKLVVSNNKFTTDLLKKPPANDIELSIQARKIEKKKLQNIAVKNCEDLAKRIVLLTKGEVKAFSVEQYMSKISFTWKAMHKDQGEFDCKDFSPFLEYEETHSFLRKFRENNPINTLGKDLGALAGILKYLGHRYNEAQKYYSKEATKINREYEEKRGNNAWTPEQLRKLNGLDYTKFVAAGRKIKNPYERAVYSMFSEMPPRRLDVYSLLYIKPVSFDEDKKNGINYIHVDKKDKPLRIYLNNYKTHKHYGRFTIYLDKYPKLQKVLTKYIKSDDNLHYDRVLFAKQDASLYARGSFKNEINRIFQKYSKSEITGQLLRNLFASHHGNKKISFNEKNAIANSIGHSFEQFAKYMKL